MMHHLDHEHCMQRAIELAANVPHLPFGAVIVDGRSGQILAEGWNKSSANPTWHAEIDAINRLVESHSPEEAVRKDSLHVGGTTGSTKNGMAGATPGGAQGATLHFSPNRNSG